jgi:amidase
MLSGLVQEHAVTRSVRDSAILLDATAGADIGDPYAAPPAARPFADEVGAPPGKCRIALWTEPLGGGDVDPECLEAARATARLCENLGHVVTETRPRIGEPSEMMHAFATLYAAGTASLIDDWAAVTGHVPTSAGFEPLTWALAELGRQRTGADYLGAVARLQRVSRELAQFFRDYDFLLSPTLSEPPVPLGTFSAPAGMPLMGFIRAGSYVPFLTIANVSGNPSMSVPLGMSRAGLPLGVLFTARNGDDAGLFRLAAQLEEARPDEWLRSAPKPFRRPAS